MSKDKRAKKPKRDRKAKADADAEPVAEPAHDPVAGPVAEPAPELADPKPVEPSAPEPAATEAPTTATAVPAIDAGRASFGLTRIANALGGATLCYGEPIQAGERVVVPIARVRGGGGYGFGRGSSNASDHGDGGGGGGAIEATPAGFLDITPDGVRYEAIPDPVTTARAISTGASAAAMLLSAVIGIRRASRRRRTAGLPAPRG